MKQKPGAAESKETIVKVVGARMDVDPGLLKAYILENDDLGEIWRIEGWEIPLIMRVGIKPHCKKEDYLFYEWDMMLREPYFINKVRAETDIPVPEIFCHETSCPEMQRCFTLMECMPGSGANVDGRHSNSSFMDSVVSQLGIVARKLHDITNDSFGYIADVGSAMEPQKTWFDAFRVMLEKTVTPLRERTQFSKEHADRIFSCYEKYRSSFDLVEKPSLIHSDLWHANVLVNESARLLGVIDWDMALWGDPGLDFYTVNMRCLNRVAFKASYRHKDIWFDPDYILRQKFYKLYQILRIVFIYNVRLRMKAEGRAYLSAILEYLKVIEDKPFETSDVC